MSSTQPAVAHASVATALPVLPELANVVSKVREDSVGIDFDPFEGAVDYRVYPLPADSEISAAPDGKLTIKNAVYRCAGTRQTFDLRNAVNAKDPNLVQGDIYGTASEIDADEAKNIFGYVDVTAAPGRLPVYALAGRPTDKEFGWREFRHKIYTTSQVERRELLAQNWRDDGIVFYVPATASARTHTLYRATKVDTFGGRPGTRPEYSQFYFNAQASAAHAGDDTPAGPAFELLTAADADTKPLLGVQYHTPHSHIELAVGRERFHRAAYQGNGPLWHLEWAGLEKPTVLVVEALSAGCPFQGFLAPQHLEAPPHQTFFTLEELQRASATGEAFINGQYAADSSPKPIARAFVSVAPSPHRDADWDWYQGFKAGSSFGPVQEIPGCKVMNCGRWRTSIFDFSTYQIDSPSNVPVLAYGQFMGQLWVAYDDAGQDVTGKVRFTALQKASVPSDPERFLHVTMSVDMVTTDRRYPQLIISDQEAPVQEALLNPNQNSLLVQPIDGPSPRFEVQAIHGLVNGRSWDVNNQAPEHRLVDYDAGSTAANDPSLQPNEPPFEHVGMDRMTKFDVYASSQRLYLFVDDLPAGCTKYPPNFKLTGPVTVTFGDVLYHEGAEDERICAHARPYQFMHAHQCSETKRHFDDLGFKSGLGAPKWDHKKFPCVAY